MLNRIQKITPIPSQCSYYKDNQNRDVLKIEISVGEFIDKFRDIIEKEGFYFITDFLNEYNGKIGILLREKLLVPKFVFDSYNNNVVFCIKRNNDKETKNLAKELKELRQKYEKKPNELLFIVFKNKFSEIHKPYKGKKKYSLSNNELLKYGLYIHG